MLEKTAYALLYFFAKSSDVIQFSKKIKKEKKSFDICNTDLISEIKVCFIIVEWKD